MSLIERIADERFMAHRRQSTSTAGMACALIALGLFAYRFYWQHLWSNDLLAVALTFVGIKLALMTYYTFMD